MLQSIQASGRMSINHADWYRSSDSYRAEYDHNYVFSVMFKFPSKHSKCGILPALYISTMTTKLEEANSKKVRNASLLNYGAHDTLFVAISWHII